VIDVSTQEQPLLPSVNVFASVVAGLTAPSRMGRAAIAPRVKTVLIRTFGDFGSARKMWCISGNFPYLKGFSAVLAGTPLADMTFRVKASTL